MRSSLHGFTTPSHRSQDLMVISCLSWACPAPTTRCTCPLPSFTAAYKSGHDCHIHDIIIAVINLHQATPGRSKKALQPALISSEQDGCEVRRIMGIAHLFGRASSWLLLPDTYRYATFPTFFFGGGGGGRGVGGSTFSLVKENYETELFLHTCEFLNQ